MSTHSAVSVWQEQKGEISWQCSCGMVHRHIRSVGGVILDAVALTDEAIEALKEKLQCALQSQPRERVFRNVKGKYQDPSRQYE